MVYQHLIIILFLDPDPFRCKYAMHGMIFECLWLPVQRRVRGKERIRCAVQLRMES